MPGKIQSFLLACALALPAAPAAAEYQALCLRNTGDRPAGFRMEIVKRGVSPDGPGEVLHSFRLDDIPPSSVQCASPADAGIAPGDGVRFLADPAGDAFNQGGRRCGPFKGRARDFEGFFLIPDGPPEGRLVFKSGGNAADAACELEHDGERMHSACGAAVNGMGNGGCNPFELDQDLPDGLGAGVGRQIPDAVERNVSIGRFADLIDRARLDANQVNENGESGLHLAARHGRAAHLDFLIRRGANMDLRDGRGGTPVMTALTGGRPDMLRRLLRAGANPNLGRRDGEFPLRLAAARGDAGLARLLLDHGAEVNARHPQTGQSALDAARARRDGGRESTLSVLRAAGAGERRHRREIPGIISADAGAAELRAALARGADVNQSGADRLTGLHLAALLNRPVYADILIASGADVNRRDGRGRTPLMAAIEADPAFPSVALSLLRSGAADLNLPRDDGAFPLYLAAQMARYDIVEMIFFFAGEGRVEVNQRHPETGRTALGLANAMFRKDSRAEIRRIQLALLNHEAKE